MWKEKKIKKTQRAVSLFNGEKTHSVTAAILCEITVGTHGPCCRYIPLAFYHWWIVCLHNECPTVGYVNTLSVCTPRAYICSKLILTNHILIPLITLFDLWCACVEYDAFFPFLSFLVVEIFTDDLSFLASGNTAVVSSYCLHICMEPNDVPHFGMESVMRQVKAMQLHSMRE